MRFWISYRSERPWIFIYFCDSNNIRFLIISALPLTPDSLISISSYLSVWTCSYHQSQMSTYRCPCHMLYDCLDTKWFSNSDMFKVEGLHRSFTLMVFCSLSFGRMPCNRKVWRQTLLNSNNNILNIITTIVAHNELKLLAALSVFCCSMWQCWAVSDQQGAIWHFSHLSTTEQTSDFKANIYPSRHVWFIIYLILRLTLGFYSYHDICSKNWNAWCSDSNMFYISVMSEQGNRWRGGFTPHPMVMFCYTFQAFHSHLHIQFALKTGAWCQKEVGKSRHVIFSKRGVNSGYY